MLNKDQLIFDAADPADSDQVGSRILAGTDGDQIASQTIGGSEWLQVASALFDGTGNAISSTAGALNVNISSGSLGVDLDGVYDGGSNTNPDNVGIIAHVRNATPGDAQQTLRLTGAAASSDNVDPANTLALDVNSFLMGWDGAAWDRISVSSGAIQANISANLVADDAADAGGSLKVGGRAIDQSSALTALSAASDRGDLLMDLYRRVWVNDSCNVGITNTAVSVDTTVGGVLLPATARAGRKRMIIQNTSATQEVYLGASGVTTSSGLVLGRKSSVELDLGEGVAIYGITGASTANVRVLELA